MELNIYFVFIVIGCLTRVAEIDSILQPCENKLARRHEDGNCYRINRQGPCKSGQKFYSFGNITGVCDCPDDRNLLYWSETDECFQRNTQGPCKKGEWITFLNETTCLPLPDGCRDDGTYVYWSPDVEEEPARCYKVGERGPCRHGEKIVHKEGHIVCTDSTYTAVEVPFLKCPRGSQRYSLGCREIFTFNKSPPKKSSSFDFHVLFP